MPQDSSADLRIKSKQLAKMLPQIEHYLTDIDKLFLEYTNEGRLPDRYKHIRKLIVEHLDVARIYALSLRDDLEAR